MHKHTESHCHSSRTSSSRLFWTIAANILITIAEFVGGILSGSLALLSDAAHNLSDVISLIISWGGEKLSLRKSSVKYSFGFKRIEIFTALINSFSLWIIAVFIVYEAYFRFTKIHEMDINFSILLPVACVGLLGNLASIFLLFKEKNKNLNLKAAFLHLLYDAVSSVAVIIGAIIIYFTGMYILDLIISLFIALLIFWSGWKIILESLHILMQGVPNAVVFNNVCKEIIKLEPVESLHDLHIWALNSTHYFLSCHIILNKKQKDIESNDQIITDINCLLKDKFNINHTSIQIENNALCDNEPICKK